MPTRQTSKSLGAKLKKRYDGFLSQRRAGKMTAEAYKTKTSALFAKQRAHDAKVAQKASARAEQKEIEKEGIKLAKKILRDEARDAKNTYLLTITADKNVSIVTHRGLNNKKLKNPKVLRSFEKPGAFTHSQSVVRKKGESMKAFKARVEAMGQDHVNSLNHDMHDTGGNHEPGGEASYVTYGNAKTSISAGGGGQVGMTRKKPYKYEFMEFASIVDDGNCVPESLHKLYPKYSVESIMDSMGGTGAKTCQQVLEWCMTKDITCIGTDEKYNIIVEYYSQNRNKKPLYFVEKDNHFYLMDKSKGLTIANSRSNSHKKYAKVEDDITYKNVVVDCDDGEYKQLDYNVASTNYIVRSASDVKYILYKYIDDNHAVPKVQFASLNSDAKRMTVFIKSFSFGNNNKITIDPHHALIEELNTKLKSKANTLGDLVKGMIKPIPTSFMNSVIMDIFTTWRKGQHYASLYHRDNWAMVKGVEQTWDANKMYTSALLNMPCAWMLFDMFALPSPYSGGVKDAYYYIETRNTMPCKGNGWYSRLILEWLIKNKAERKAEFEASLEEGDDDTFQDNNADFKVIYEIVASTTLPSYSFKGFVQNAVDLTDKFKFITNTFCGTLNSHATRIAKGHISSNKNNIVGKCMTTDAHLLELSSEVYACASVETRIKNDNNMPMYAQIIDFASIQLANTIQHLKSKGCVIRGYNTDSVTFKHPEQLTIDLSTDKIGGWKNEDPKPCGGDIPPTRVVEKYTYTEPTWQSIMTETDFADTQGMVDHIVKKNESLSLDGQAGFGKSYLLDKFIQTVGADNCLVLGYTNISAHNIGGKTFHSTFKIDVVTGLEKFDAKTILTNKKWLIIDEKSQVPSTLYRICQTADTMGIPIIMAGDFAQILAIEKSSNHEAYIKLLCKNLLTLTKYKRGDANLLKALTAVRNRTSKLDFTRGEHGQLHFCFTKARRNWINAREMAKVTHGYMNMPKNPNLPKIYNQMPLRACETKENGDWMNNERWTLIKMYEEYCVIKNAEKSHVVPYKVLVENFVPGYAMTIHSSQGLTISEPYTVWIETHTAFSQDDEWRLIYTALSRATTKDQIRVMIN